MDTGIPPAIKNPEIRYKQVRIFFSAYFFKCFLNYFLLIKTLSQFQRFIIAF